MSIVYIHYGSNYYDPERFKIIKNDFLSVKPQGGMWCSPENARYGWKEWCEYQDYHTEKLEHSFRFTLASHANILQINNKGDLTRLPKLNFPVVNGKDFLALTKPWIFLDFEKLLTEGIDAIQVNMSNDTATRFDEKLCNVLGCWDCDSVLIMNKDVVLSLKS